MKATERYDSLFQYYGGARWSLLKAQALAESALNPDAESAVGAVGLAQFMPATWKDFVMRKGWVAAGALFDPRDPEDSIRAQAAYMDWLLAQTNGDIPLALAAYNWGIGNVRLVFLSRHQSYSPELVPKETRDYIARIKRTMNGDLYASVPV